MNNRAALRRAMLAALAVVVSGWAAAQPVSGASADAGTDAGHTAQTNPSADPLDSNAVMHRSVAGRPLMSIARAGRRLVAVGMRGLIVASDDDGKTWIQVPAPVRSDLLDLSFPVANEGWAVGHDGVILHTDDGGRSWKKQFDGRLAANVLIENYRKRIAAGDVALQPYLDQLTLNYRSGPSLPFLGVWFADAQHGIAVGSFGMAVATDDGGKSWVPALDRIHNPGFLHLQAIGEVAGDVFVAAEKGVVFRLDRTTGRFVPVETGYAGSFFGVTGHEGVLVAYGLKGTMYRSTNRGASWSRIDSPLHGLVTGAAYIAQQQAFVFVTAAGEIALCDQTAHTFRLLKAGRPVVATGVLVPSSRDLVLSGLSGISTVALR